MSTANEIGRWPESESRWAIQSGVVAAGSMPLTTRATNTGQPAGSSMTTGYPSPLGAGTSRCAGSEYGAS